MKEIGSEFWEVPASDEKNDLFPNRTQWFLSGRSALQAVIKELGEARSVSLPSWCCDSMIKPFADAGYAVRFYPVVFEDGLVQEFEKDTDVVFLMDYFGYTSASPDLSGYQGVVIRDVTHSIFSAASDDADYCFGSFRKWCGVWTGGYAWTGDGHELTTEAADEADESVYITLRAQAMKEKQAYMTGLRTDKGYLKVFGAAEDSLETAGIAPAAERDVFLAQHLCVKRVTDRRRANAEVLRSAFADRLIFPELKPTDTPMFVPILVHGGKRNALRRYLIDHEIYCPVHWPVSEYHKLNEQERYIYDNELSLVCDQRYTEEDMNRMVETIKAFMED